MGAAKGIEKLNFKLYKHGKERDIEVDAADIGIGDYGDLNSIGSNKLYGRLEEIIPARLSGDYCVYS